MHYCTWTSAQPQSPKVLCETGISTSSSQIPGDLVKKDVIRQPHSEWRPDSVGSDFQICHIHSLSCGPQTTNQTPLLHCLTLEINLHETSPVITGRLRGVSPSSSLTTPSTYGGSENRIIWSWEREADFLDFQLSRGLPPQCTVVRSQCGWLRTEISSTPDCQC